MSGFYRAPITPGQTWFSPAGGGNTPAAAGTIDTFLAGTTTPAQTYADNTGGTSNGVQIVLNSAGRLPTAGAGSDIWLPGGVAYKFVIQDAVGNPIATVDNITGENDPAFAAGGFEQWIGGPAATWISAASFSCAGDQVSLGPLNRDRRIEITSGAGVTHATITSSSYSVGPNLTTVTFTADTNDPTPTNPITALRYGVLSVDDTSFPSAALQLGAPVHRTAGSTNTLLFGPIGSNLVAFTVPPNVVAAAGGAGDQQVTGTVNGVAGSLTFNKTAHGRITGEVVQLSVNAPPNTALLTSFIVFVVDANNFGLYALPSGWQFEQPYLSPSNPGGLTWGNPVAFGGAAAGATTVTPGFVAPQGVTRVKATVLGAGGGGGGSRGSTGNGGAGGNGGNTTFSTFTGNGGTGGTGGTVGSGLGTAPGSATGGTLNLQGNSGHSVVVAAGAATIGGQGGASCLGGARGQGTDSIQGSGGTGGNATAAAQSGGGGGGSGGVAIGPLAVTTGTFLAATVGAGGTAGVAGTGTNSAAGQAGGAGVVIVEW